MIWLEREIMREERKLDGRRWERRKRKIKKRREMKKNEKSKNRMRYKDKEILWWKYKFWRKKKKGWMLDIYVGEVMDGEIGMESMK